MDKLKPREFWVYPGKRNCEPLIFVYKSPQEIKQLAPENWDEIHVIEYSAYEELKKRLEERDQVRLWNENEKLREERDHWKRCFYILQDAKNESK